MVSIADPILLIDIGDCMDSTVGCLQGRKPVDRGTAERNDWDRTHCPVVALHEITEPCSHLDTETGIYIQV